MFIVKHKNTILCPCAPHAYVRYEILEWEWTSGYGQKSLLFACPLWTTKKWIMSRAIPTSTRHRSPLCIIVHNAARWCTTQLGGAQCSPALTKWSQRSSHKPRQMHRQIDRQTDRKRCLLSHHATLWCLTLIPHPLPVINDCSQHYLRNIPMLRSNGANRNT